MTCEEAPRRLVYLLEGFGGFQLRKNGEETERKVSIERGGLVKILKDSPYVTVL